jgi:hypothetical protein
MVITGAFINSIMFGNNCLDIRNLFLNQYHAAGDTFLSHIFTGDKMWFQHYETKS